MVCNSFFKTFFDKFIQRETETLKVTKVIPINNLSWLGNNLTQWTRRKTSDNQISSQWVYSHPQTYTLVVQNSHFIFDNWPISSYLYVKWWTCWKMLSYHSKCSMICVKDLGNPKLIFRSNLLWSNSKTTKGECFALIWTIYYFWSFWYMFISLQNGLIESLKMEIVSFLADNIFTYCGSCPIY